MRRVVHGDTARRLTAALRLSEPDRARFDAPARGALASTQPPSDLPVPPTRLVGRSRELTCVIARASGPAGQAADADRPGRHRQDPVGARGGDPGRGLFCGGVFFVALGELRDAALLAPELAKMIDMVETGPELVELLPRRPAGRRALVVMDAVELLIPAVPLVYCLLATCPSATFLVPGRSVPRVRGEHEFPVPPLALPSATHKARPDDIVRWPATALFWERSQTVRPVLDLDPQTASLIAEHPKRSTVAQTSAVRSTANECGCGDSSESASPCRCRPDALRIRVVGL